MNHKHIALLCLLALAPISIAHAQDTTTTTTDTTTTDSAATDTTTTTTTTDTVAAEPPVEATTTTTSTTTVDSEVAAPSSPPSSAVAEPTVLVSIRGGVFIPQVFNRLDTSFTVGLGVGYVLPFLDHRVAIVLDAFYTRPERSQLSLPDPRLAGGTYSYDMVQNDISMFVGFLVHFTDLARDLIVPYAGLGARVHFLWSDIDGNSGGQVLGSHRETSTQGGGAIRVGCGIRLGPGMIALDVELGLAPLDHLITGGSNIGNLGISAGYTLIL